MKKKKITFLLLHIGYGGIESSTINTANALADKYDIELVVFYNLKKNQANYIKSNISIKYLYHGEPNRNEFKEAIRKKNIVRIFQEGIKAIDILTKKRYLIKKVIKESKSFAIISTRCDFSILLSRYGQESVVKIAQEHHHHNNNKRYISLLKYRYNHIDYLFALTESLCNDYKIFLKNNHHTKVMLVPNMVDEIPMETSSLEKKNIISICRLHEGKKIDELVEIFSQIDNKESKLYIIGDGDEEEKVNKKINSLGLNERVIMLGYLSKEEQKQYILDSALYAMTSVSEGLPMVLIEAMGYGLPCIAYETDCGVADIIDDAKNGYIIPKRSQEQYVSMINKVFTEDTLLMELSKMAKESSYRFQKDNIKKIWYSVLEQ